MSLIELACRSAACAPPPVGTGGSTPGGGTKAIFAQYGGSEIYTAVKLLEAEGAITPSTRPPLTGGPRGLISGVTRTDFRDALLDYGGNVNSIVLRPHVTKGVVATQQYLKDRFGEGARVILFRGTDRPSDPFRETMVTANQMTDEGPSGITSWTANRSLAEGYGPVVVAAVPIDRILSWDWIGTQADSTMIGSEVIVGSVDGVRKAAAGDFPAMERLRPTTASALIELACHSASCAPPPVGTGGSSEGGAADYRIQHTAPDRESGAAAHDLTGGNKVYPPDFWENPHYYWYNDRAIDREVTDVLRSVRGNPDAEVTVYRSLPPEHADDGINPKDWVTLSRAYAEGHGMHAEDPSQDWPVVERTVRAADLFTAGDSLAEWGWDPENVTAAGCQSEACAPPPVGTGGSLTDRGFIQMDDLADLPEGFVTDGEDAAKRVFEFEFTDREGRKFISKTDEVEESDAGVVTIEGTIFAPVPIGGGRLRQHAVGYFTRQVDGWRMHHDSLSIMPQHQGKGIGSAFIAESMRRAADEGVTLVSTSALSTKTSNGVYTWLRAGFDTPSGNVTAVTTRKRIANRIEALGGSASDTPSVKLANKLRGRETVTTAELLANPRSREFLGQSGGGALQMELQMDISDLKTEAALAASVPTDWVERAITFTLAEDETWYEPLADEDLTAAGCQDASCAPPPVGTGGSKSVSVYHLTDDPKFAPRADFVPEDNTVSIRERTNPGLYVAKGTWDVERWVNGSGYLRPYVAEITVPEDAMVDERWGGEGFIPGDKLDQVTVKRLIPVDAFAREVYGDYGWVEDTLGTKFDTGEPVPTDNSVRYAEGGRPTNYVYDGPDVRDMPETETKRLARDAEKALGIRTGTTASADPFAGLEVYGFACHDASCAPPPIGTGGSAPGVDIPGIADQEAYDRYRETTNNVQLLDIETAAYAQQQIQDAEVIVRVSADRLSDILNYSEPEDWELRSMHDPQNEVGRSLRGEEYLQHRDLYDAAVGLDKGYVVHGYSEAEFSLEPIQGESDISHRVTPQAATWYGEIQLVMTDEARDDATFTISDSLNSGSVPLPIVGPIDPRAAALNGVHPFILGRDYAEVQLRAPIEISSKHVKEIRVPDVHYLQDVVHVLAERMPDTLVTIEDDGIMMTMENAVTALEELQS